MRRDRLVSALEALAPRGLFFCLRQTGFAAYSAAILEAETRAAIFGVEVSTSAFCARCLSA